MTPLLFGANSEEGIVAVYPSGDGAMSVCRREAVGLSTTVFPFYPYFLLADDSLILGFAEKYWIKTLAGDNYFRYLCAFTGWSSMWDAVRSVIGRYNSGAKEKADSFAEVLPLHLRPDPVSQFLLQTGRTLFKGIEFEDLRRLQVGIRTLSASPRRPGNPQRREDRIVFIALSDARGWEQLLDGRELAEPEMLQTFIEIVRTRDPDVIEGHDAVHFILPYLLGRCALLGVEPSLGRDGSSPRAFDARLLSAAFDAGAHEIAGRHLIDTLLLAQSYDATNRSLEDLRVHSLAGHFGIPVRPAAILPPERTSSAWEREPSRLRDSLTEEVRIGGRLAEILSRSVFHQTRMLPYNFGAVARLGASAKIESLLVREYVRQRHSIPKPEPVTPITGGATEIYLTGVVGPVINIDVESLYPSIMLGESIGPESEPLGIFLELLGELTAMRLEAKRAMQTEKEQDGKRALDAVQAAYKILINSFYGYLGYTKALFNDPSAADAITRTGQKHLRTLIEKIRETDGTVVEVDTDGIYFIPPGGIDSGSMESYIEQIGQALPKGYALSMAGFYKKMLSYKKKNYALLANDGSIVIRGSSLTARSIEQFCRDFLRRCITALLAGDIDRIHRLYGEVRKRIIGHRLTAAEFSRTETLRESGAEYLRAVEAGTRNKTAAYEVALASGMNWRPGDKISTYVTGTDPAAKEIDRLKPAEDWDPSAPDENVPYYLRRLDEAAARFEVFFSPQDFRLIFSSDDLFPFSSDSIRIVTHTLGEVTKEEEEESEGGQPELKIWLAEDTESS